MHNAPAPKRTVLSISIKADLSVSRLNFNSPVLLIAGALCIAFASIFAVLSMRVGGVGWFDSAFWRMAIGTVTMGVVLLVIGRKKNKTDSSPGISRFAGWLWVPGIGGGDIDTLADQMLLFCD